MTKENLTSINVIIDKSGSMAGLTNDTIGNFNTFLSDQKAFPGEALFTLCLFNESYILLHDSVPINTVPNLDAKSYRPSGSTGLLDAVGATINSVGTKLAAMNEEDRPARVVFLVITDGEENCSREFSLDKIKEMVTHQQDKYSWEFVFMGANIDAFSAGQSLGVSVQNTMNYSATSGGTKSLYKSISDNMTSYRARSSSVKGDFFNKDIVVTPAPVVDVILPTVTKDKS